MKPILALSTCWCSHRHQDGYAMLQEMAGLGFQWVELSHGIRITLVPGILRAVEEGVIRVASCHNFCPLPSGILHAAPNLYLPTSRSRQEREQWLRHSQRTLDFAQQVGARNVVLHLGSVEFPWFNPVRRFTRYLETHAAAARARDPDYHRLLARTLARVRARQPAYWVHLQASLAALLPHAGQRGLRLGLENRERIEELPLDAEYADFLQSFPAAVPVGYWHDTGHGHIKESLGLLNHRHHLALNAPRTIGFHLHDVTADGHDHQAVGSGQVDFAMISEFWRPEHELVLEHGPWLTPDEVLQSRQRVEALLTQRFGP